MNAATQKIISPKFTNAIDARESLVSKCQSARCGKQKANPFQVFQVKHQKLGPLCYLSGVRCAGSWGWDFQKEHSTSFLPAGNAVEPISRRNTVPPSSERDVLYIIVVTLLFLSFLSCKIVDPVYCKAELIPHCKRLWDSGQESFIINTDKLLTSYIQPMMCGLWCQSRCWLPSKTQTIQEPNLLSDFFLCVTKLAAFLWTDTHIPPPLPMPQIIKSSNSLESFREQEIVIKKDSYKQHLEGISCQKLRSYLK